MDFELILICVLLIINVILWGSLYVYYRTHFTHREKPQQSPPATVQINTANQVQMQSIAEVRNKVDALLQIHKL